MVKPVNIHYYRPLKNLCTNHMTPKTANTYLVSWVYTMLPQSAMHHHHSSPNFHPKNNVYILHITSRPTSFTNTSTTILQIAKLSNLSLKLPSSSSFNHQYPKHHTSPPSKSPYLYHQNPHHQNFIISHHLYHHKSPQQPCPSQPSLLSNEGKLDSKLRLDEQDIDREEETGM